MLVPIHAQEASKRPKSSHWQALGAKAASYSPLRAVAASRALCLQSSEELWEKRGTRSHPPALELVASLLMEPSLVSWSRRKIGRAHV